MKTKLIGGCMTIGLLTSIFFITSQLFGKTEGVIATGILLMATGIAYVVDVGKIKGEKK
jgi:hypothetical protein